MTTQGFVIYEIMQKMAANEPLTDSNYQNERTENYETDFACIPPEMLGH
jgi:hypothetical protein